MSPRLAARERQGISGQSQPDWEAFRAQRNLLEASHRGLQQQLIPAWVRQTGSPRARQRFSDRVQACAYGETPAYLVEAVLDLLAPAPDELFVDLGCGAGNVCAAALARGARVLGIEQNPELAGAARGFLATAPVARWRLVEGDLLENSWSDANLAYATTVRFPNSLLQAIADRAEQAPRLRAVVCLGRPLPLSWATRELGERLVCWNPGENHRWEPLFWYGREP